MPLYYFDCHHAGCDEQCLGHDLPDHETAHKLGVVFAGEMLQHEAQTIVAGHDLKVAISDEHHLVLFSVYATSLRAPSTACMD